MRRMIWILVGIVFGSGALAAQEKAKGPLSPLAGLKAWEVPYMPLSVEDPFGAADTLWLDLQKGAKPGEWVLYFNAFNDESLFAMSFPIRHDSLMKLDSASQVGTRTDFFKTKIVNDENSVPNTVTIGLFTALNPKARPLSPGRGTVLKVYFKAPPTRPISIRSVAPILMPPGLEFVTPAGQAVHPVVLRVGEGAPPVSPSVPAPEKPASKPGKKGK